MSAATYIASLDELFVNCRTMLPSTLNCGIAIQSVDRFAGASIDLKIEQPNYKTAVSNEKYFNGNLNCHAFTEDSFMTEVKQFTTSIKNGRLSFKAPKFGVDFSGEAYVRCIGTDVILPPNFGIVKDSNGSIEEEKESSLRVRAEYKRGNISRQYADASPQRESYNLILPPHRIHGRDKNGDLIPYKPLAMSATVESSGTILDAKTGYKLVLKGINHKLNTFYIDHLGGYGYDLSWKDKIGARFSSLAPLNTYYEKSSVGRINCTAEISGSSSISFETTLIFEDGNFGGVVNLQTRDPENHGEWISVNVDTTGADLTLSCPQLTVLNPTELPTITTIVGYADNYTPSLGPSILLTSSALGFTSFVIFSTVATIAVAALSIF